MIKKGLSIAGGGFKGLMTAEFLRLLEEETGPLGEKFDVVSGTSVGSLIATGICLGTPMERIVELMLGGGEYIFPPEAIPLSGAAKKAFSSGKHDPGRLERIISSVTGDARLDDCETPIIISAVDLTSARAKVFKSGSLGGSPTDGKLLLSDLAMASAAAPTFFPPHKIGPKYYCDGGLFANAPDLPNAVELRKLCVTPNDYPRLLCVGTPDKDHALASSARTGKLRGIDWASLSDPVLLNQMMSAQMTFNKYCAEGILGPDCIADVSPVASHRQSEVLGLDVASADAKDTLFSIAHDAFEEFRNGKAKFLSEISR